MHLPLHLDRNRGAPLQNQLFEQLRYLIVSGQMKPESRVIATRFLSEQLNVSRTTVLLAYERLIAEGYLETRPAIGTFVSRTPPDGTAAPKPHPAPISVPARQECAIDFAIAPDDQLFPFKSWLRATQTVLDRHERRSVPIDYLPNDSGLPALRAVIREWLAFHRGITADPEQVIIVAGVQQALAIAASLAGVRGRMVVTENPGEPQVSALFAGLGARLYDCPVDEQGLDTALLPEEPAALLHATPSYQRPLGAMLPLDRREKLLAWAAENGALLLEDDSDGDFRYQGSAQPALFTLAPPGRVIYLRRFSETMNPGLRLVYLVVPPEMVKIAQRIKASLDSGTPRLEQQVLAEFILSGGYDRHLRMTRKILLERRDALILALTRHFGDIKLLGTGAGTSVNWLLPAHLGSADLVRDNAAKGGVKLYRPLSPQSPVQGRSFIDGILAMGYATLTAQDIKKGVDLLADTLVMYQRAAQ